MLQQKPPQHKSLLALDGWRKVPLYRDSTYYECMKLADLYRVAGWCALVKLTDRRTFDGFPIGQLWVAWEPHF